MTKKIHTDVEIDGVLDLNSHKITELAKLTEDRVENLKVWNGSAWA